MRAGRWGSRVHPARVDAVLACTLAAVAVVYGRQSYADQYRAAGWPPFDATAIALSLAVCLPLAVRRRFPRAVLACSLTALALYTAVGYQPSANPWVPLPACYTVVVRRPARDAAPAAAATFAAWAYCGVAAHLSPELTLAQSVLGVGVVTVFATAARRLAERNAQLAEATVRLRREQELRARHAVVEERMRIARELHDVIAHHLSALAVQAGLAEFVFTSDPEQARASLTAIGATSREALEEMRGLLQVLRVTEDEPGGGPDGEAAGGTGGPGAGTGAGGTGGVDGTGGTGGVGPPYRPAPGLADLDDLCERTRAAGVPVRVETAGTARPLTPGADLCAFRTVQESLTNAIKHAGRPATATVRLHWLPDRLEVRVSDDGPGGGQALPGGGLGLIGVRERARLYGGFVHAGPRPDGGFEVALTLPLAAAGP